MKTCLAALLWLASGALAAIAQANDRAPEPATIEARATPLGVEVRARALVKASHDIAWATLTDYEHLPQWVPNLSASKVLQRQGAQVTVEQSGHVPLWWFRYPIHVVVQAREAPPDAIDVSLVRGNLRRLEGGYRLGRGADDTVLELRWVGVIEPDLELPAALTIPLVRNVIRLQFDGMVREIERRAEAAAR